MPEVGTQTSLAPAGSGVQTGAEWDRQTRKIEQRVSRGCRRKSGQWRVVDGGWRRPNGGGRVDDEYGVSLGGCVGGNSSEPMAQAHPDVPAEEDRESKKSPNKANLESTHTSSPQKDESGLTGPARRKQSHL